MYGIFLSRKKSLTIRLCFDSVTLLAEKTRSAIRILKKDVQQFVQYFNATFVLKTVQRFV